MEAVQITRDSVSSEDAVRSPHVVAVRLSPTPTLGELAGWVVDHHYLAGLPQGDDWVLRLGSRVGPPVVRFSTRATDVPRVSLLGDPEHSLTGVGSVHLEWRAGSVDMED